MSCFTTREIDKAVLSTFCLGCLEIPGDAFQRLYFQY